MRGTTAAAAAALAAAALAAITPALAQTRPSTPAAPAAAPPPPAKPSAAVGSAPERTTATFGDWVLRCEAVQAQRVCEVAQVVTWQGQTNPVGQLAIGKPAAGEGRQLTVVLPASIAILTRPQVTIAKTDAAPIELIWQRCFPGACIASAPVADEIVNGLAAQSEPGRIVFKDSGDREIALSLSFRGLPQALAALAKEQ
jgi:invasion protein IalB